MGIVVRVDIRVSRPQQLDRPSDANMLSMLITLLIIIFPLLLRVLQNFWPSLFAYLTLTICTITTFLLLAILFRIPRPYTYRFK